MKNSKLKIFLRGLSLAAVMAAGAAIISIAGIECLVQVSNMAFNKFCIVCVGAVSTFAGVVGFTYEAREAIEENKLFMNHTAKQQEENEVELEGFSLTKTKSNDTIKSNIEPVVIIDNIDIKREISNEKPKEFVLKKETRKF